MEAFSYTGRGVAAAVLDTGIFPHIDFDSRILGFHDFVFGNKEPYDDNGHGTHVAGILAGNGKASGGRYRGIAPDCRIVALKVLDRHGNGKKETLLQAFEWLLRNYRKYGIRIVNISVGTTFRNLKSQMLLVSGVEQLWDEGLIVVAAAGNDGPGSGSITAPGCSRKIITVGSSDMLEGRSGISGRGPTVECVFKPDLVTEGRGIISCSAGPGMRYEKKSGTSMSTPVISGAIACFLEKHPETTNVSIKQLLKKSCEDLKYPQNIQGWGKFMPDRFLML